MPIDFSSAVLFPCMQTFARVVTFDPVVSRPNSAPYVGRAIFTTSEYDVLSADGGLFSDQKTWLGYRLADFTGPPPMARDLVTTDDGRRFIIDDIDVDGQGGAKAKLRLITPDYP